MCAAFPKEKKGLMKKLIVSLSILLILPLLSVSASAQGEVKAESAEQFRITEKEVVAVQTELSRRGFYNSKPTGILDRNTRAAVRAYQTETGLQVTGRIDRETYEKLELPYPATGKERDNTRRGGLLPKIGYGVKDKVVSAGETISGTAGGVKKKAASGVDKTKDMTSGAVSKTKETAQGVGDSTAKGAKNVGRETQRASDSLVGRSDADVQSDIREVLGTRPETEKWYSEVKDGRVTIKTPPDHNVDIGAVISDIRKVGGVKSVFVIAE
jgi:peptidoglycan hydrolase-like protein with peptidoglycan-binding domain